MQQLHKNVTKDNMRSNYVPTVLKPAKCSNSSCKQDLKDSVIDGLQFCDNPNCSEYLKAVEGKRRYKKQAISCECWLHLDLKKHLKKIAKKCKN